MVVETLYLTIANPMRREASANSALRSTAADRSCDQCPPAAMALEEDVTEKR
jgi:hypothetical protein